MNKDYGRIPSITLLKPHS